MRERWESLSAYRRWSIIATLAIVFVGGPIYGAITWVTGAAEAPRTLQHCRVTEKSHRNPPQSHSRNSTSDTRYVYTEGCDVLEASDWLPKNHRGGEQLWNGLEVGATYDFEVVGKADNWMSRYPIILRATKTS